MSLFTFLWYLLVGDGLKAITTSLFEKVLSTLKFCTTTHFLQHEFQQLYNVFL